ncbi:MAG: carbon-nitrogen hydrolase family protein [Boseongicola sp. SB0676_bin_33]|nr:carbon-nitrogen hydrolase family protein [Boseongicola sp. SB0676_bin_33]
MKAALLQLNSSDDPQENLRTVSGLVEDAAEAGAKFVLTPEVTNCVSASRSHQGRVLAVEEQDETLASLRRVAERLDIWLLLGSIALTSGDEKRFLNRSFLISPGGEITARYDKIHMFDVAISETESYRESDGYRAGDKAVLGDMDGVPVGLTICYDLRFPYLFRGLAKAGARILTVPSAFSRDTGQAHWEPLLRARAIETGCFVLAPAQCGVHAASQGRQRATHGHSLTVDPWGRILCDGGNAPGVNLVDLNMNEVDDARRRIPSLTSEQFYAKA